LPTTSTHPLFIGIDIGGTFTDFVVYDPQTETIRTLKVLSSPSEPEKAVLEGMQQVKESGYWTVVHGSTIATNSLLERKGHARHL